jgi:hypothetical protein
VLVTHEVKNKEQPAKAKNFNFFIILIVLLKIVKKLTTMLKTKNPDSKNRDF